MLGGQDGRSKEGGNSEDRLYLLRSSVRIEQLTREMQNGQAGSHFRGKQRRNECPQHLMVPPTANPASARFHQKAWS